MTDTIYKMTDQEMRTHGGYQWELGKPHQTKERGPELCKSGWLHSYTSIELAVFLNPIHADLPNPRGFVGRGGGQTLDDRGLKRGYSWMVLDREIDVPEPTPLQVVYFGIACAQAVSTNPDWQWAADWISGKDRSASAAWSAESAARSAARSAERSADLNALAKQALEWEE